MRTERRLQGTDSEGTGALAAKTFRFQKSFFTVSLQFIQLRSKIHKKISSFAVAEILLETYNN
jgi:hypothetical protein